VQPVTRKNSDQTNSFRAQLVPFPGIFYCVSLEIPPRRRGFQILTIAAGGRIEFQSFIPYLPNSMLRSIEFDPSSPETSLTELADYCEQNPIPPKEIPKPFLDYYGIECLSNSLNLIFPKLPPFDEADDVKFMESQEFRTFDSLADAIASRSTDMDRLFCLFY
jgi:hypothetical protein